ncbi:MAG: hypothetical protein GF331_15485 [Chitinivibrionales bacterium]|nr:hypothetical protein [Chitinivibrionales bacterium]
MKWASSLLFGGLAAVIAASVPVPAYGAVTDDSWLSAVQDEIRRSEYHVRYQESHRAYQSPNREQNLRVTYHDDGFTLTPRDESRGSWRVSLRLQAIERDGATLRPRTDVLRRVNGNRLDIYHGADFTIHYDNGTDGMRQDFIVRRRPAGEGELTLTLAYDGDLTLVDKGADAVLFAAVHPERGRHDCKVWYKNLRAYDADGIAVPATMRVVDAHTVALVVDDRGARYPLTVDPLSTTANWVSEGTQTNADYGISVAPAGDVNGDGYGDVVVGAPRYDDGQTDEGVAFVYYGSATGLSSSPDDVLQANVASAGFGRSVNTAGDVDGDGYSDVIIGSPTFTSGQTDEGAAYIYLGGSRGILTPYHVRIQSNRTGAKFGWSVATAGDVQNDGYSDVIVGAYLWSNGENGEGYAAVYHGSESGVDGIADWQVESNVANAELGCAVSTAGDVNRDGYSDIIIGARRFDVWDGRAYIYHGGSSGVGAVAARTLSISIQDAWFGAAVGCAGDVNADGYADVIVGAEEWSAGTATEDEGGAFIYHGSSSGIGADYAHVLAGGSAGMRFGGSVSGAGDVNGDGYGDVVVGGSLFSDGEQQEGLARVYYGAASGMQQHWEVTGDHEGAYLGFAVASAGDVNGDGFSDVIVGAHRHANGRVYVYYGGAHATGIALDGDFYGDQENALLGSSVAAGDFNGDGFSDAAVGAQGYDNGQMGEGVVFVYQGTSQGLAYRKMLEIDVGAARFGCSMSSAGDVNGDGLVDLIVGARDFTNGQINEGAAFLFYGASGSDVLSGVSAWSVEGDGQEIYLGISVAGAGDVNGDGFADLLIGARGYSDPETNEGAVFVFHGSSTGPGATPVQIIEQNQENASFGTAVSSAGDVNGDGYSDVIVAGQFMDDRGYTNCGRAYVYLGSAAGLGLAPAWDYAVSEVDAYLGSSVTHAGDVNGDGFSDIAVGAYGKNGRDGDEGAVYVWHGSASGLGPAPARALVGSASGCGFGNSVSSAGDINGDGYSDLVVGSPSFSDGEEDEGRVDFYLGGPGGIASVPAFSYAYNQPESNLGQAVACAGDINGDGFSDVLVGAYRAGDGQTEEGRVLVFCGGEMPGTYALSKQLRVGSTTPIAAGGLTDAAGSFRIQQYMKSPFGRIDSRLVYEHAINGQPFSGNPIGNSVTSTGTFSSWMDDDYYHFTTTVTASTPGVYKWRARTEYGLPKMFNGQKYGPWRYMGNEYAHQGGVRSHAMAAPPAPVIVRPPCHKTIGMADTLVWTSCATATSYNYQVSSEPDFSALARSGSTPGTRLTMTGLANGTLYYARVNAQNSVGTSFWSVVDTFRTIARPWPVYPADGAGVDTLEPALRWNQVAGRRWYNVEVARDETFADLVVRRTGIADSTTTLSGIDYGTTYYWRVGVVDSTMITSWSPVRTFTTACAQVTLASPTHNTTGCPIDQQLSWNTTAGATSYRLEIATNGRFTDIIKDTVTAQTTYQTASAYSTAYFWRVRAINAAGEGALSDIWRFVTTLEAPALVSPANDAVDQPVALDLQWGAVTGADSYHLQVSATSDFSVLYVNANSVSTTSYSLSGLQNDRRYYWRVRARNTYGDGEWSAAWSFVTEAGVTQAPILISPAQDAIDVPLAPGLEWHAFAGALDYTLVVATDENCTQPVINQAGITDTTYAATGLSAETTYYWRVFARLSGGRSDWSVIRSFTTVPPPPPQVTLVAPADGAADLAVSVDLLWFSAATAASYQVQVSTQADFSSTVKDSAGVNDTSLVLSGLANGVQYFWRVRGANSGGDSPWSAVRSFTTIIALPAEVVLVSPDSGAVNQPLSLTLQWNAASGAAGYDVQLATVGDFSTAVTDSPGVSGTSMAISGLANGVTYYWRVRASNVAGAGEWSSVWQLTTIVALPQTVTLDAPVDGAVVSDDSVDCAWYAATPAVSSYWLQVSTDSTFATTSVSDSSISDTAIQVGGCASSTWYYWRVRAGNAAGWGGWSETAGFYIEPAVVALPQEFAFGAAGLQGRGGIIRYALPKEARISVRMFDMRGKLVLTLVDAVQGPGYYSVPLDHGRMAAGCGVVVFQAGEYVVQRRLMSLR